MAERVQVRDIATTRATSCCRSCGGVRGRWCVATGADRVVVGAAHGRAAIAKIAFTSEDRVREVIHNFNDDGFDSLAPKYAGGRPPTFTLPQRREIKKIALSRPHGSRPAVLDVVAVEAGRVPGR